MTKNRLTLIFSLLALTSIAQSQKFPREINLVFDYLLKKDFPEVFNGKSYQFRPVSWQIVDIDDDGNTEVFLQTFPHYSQSPSITIFKISANDSVTRIIEGFAPGHLIPLSAEDDYITPHSTGTAIDAQIDKNEPEKLLKFANASLKFGMSCVLYKNFIHTDKKESKTFLDLTYLMDYSAENSCANFQFSKPNEIIAGKVKGASNKYFIARIENDLFCYEIKGFENDTYVNKTVTIIKAPSDLIKLVIDDGYIKYVTNKDKLQDLKI
jgi:hypothetical protein